MDLSVREVLAPKLAVTMHAMLASGQRFDRSAGLAAANG